MLEFDWVISAGSIIILAIAVLGFVGQGILHAVTLGRFSGRIDERFIHMDRRMSSLEDTAKEVSKALNTLSEQKIELQTLNRRIDDVQNHGSYKLAEILDGLRRQTLADMKDLIQVVIEKQKGS